MVALTGGLLATAHAPLAAASTGAAISGCVEPTGDETADQTSINTYQSSFNRDLIGNTALLDSYTNNGADLGVYAPVWGRGQILGILGDVTPDASLHPEYDAVGPVSVRSFNGLTDVTGLVAVAQQGDHGDAVYQYAVRAVGARGITEVHRWDVGPFNELIRTWLAAEIDGVAHPFLADHELAGAYTLSRVSADTPLAVERFIDDSDSLGVVAAGNSGLAGATVQPWARFHNAIAVGTSPRTWNGVVHSSSGTDSGRQKPDIVVSNGNAFTSFSSPMVAAQILRLREATTCYLSSDSDALRSETIKALLLAGANQTGAFDDTDYTWTRSEAAPLDPRFGAGTVDLHSSYLMMRAGEQPLQVLPAARYVPEAAEPSPVNAEHRGWDHLDVLPANSDAVLTFAGGVSDFTLAATWSYEVDDTLSSGRLADVDLTLLAWNDDCTTTEIQASRSRVDNTEYLRIADNLPAAQYTVVASNLSDDFAEVGIAWDSVAPAVAVAPLSCSAEARAGDANCDGGVDDLDAQAITEYLAGSRAGVSACPIGAGLAQVATGPADIDGDARVDLQDALLIVQCSAGVDHEVCVDG